MAVIAVTLCNRGNRCSLRVLKRAGRAARLVAVLIVRGKLSAAPITQGKLAVMVLVIVNIDLKILSKITALL